MGKSFKGFSKALSLILAVAMVVTCVPTSAYAAELLADESEDLLISNDAVAEESSDALVTDDAPASEEKSSSLIDTQDASAPVDADENTAGKEVNPDKYYEDVEVAVVYQAETPHFALVTLDGDRHSAIPKATLIGSPSGNIDDGFPTTDFTSTSISIDSTYGLTAYIVPEYGYTLPNNLSVVVTGQYEDATTTATTNIAKTTDWTQGDAVDLSYLDGLGGYEWKKAIPITLKNSDFFKNYAAAKTAKKKLVPTIGIKGSAAAANEVPMTVTVDGKEVRTGYVTTFDASNTAPILLTTSVKGADLAKYDVAVTLKDSTGEIKETFELADSKTANSMKKPTYEEGGRFAYFIEADGSDTKLYLSVYGTPIAYAAIKEDGYTLSVAFKSNSAVAEYAVVAASVDTVTIKSGTKDITTEVGSVKTDCASDVLFTVKTKNKVGSNIKSVKYQIQGQSTTANAIPYDTAKHLFAGEKKATYTAVEPVGSENPTTEIWYEADTDSPDGYKASTDTTVNTEKTYYSREVDATGEAVDGEYGIPYGVTTHGYGITPETHQGNITLIVETYEDVTYVIPKDDNNKSLVAVNDGASVIALDATVTGDEVATTKPTQGKTYSFGVTPKTGKVIDKVIVNMITEPDSANMVDVTDEVLVDEGFGEYTVSKITGAFEIDIRVRDESSTTKVMKTADSSANATIQEKQTGTVITGTPGVSVAEEGKPFNFIVTPADSYAISKVEYTMGNTVKTPTALTPVKASTDGTKEYTIPSVAGVVSIKVTTEAGYDIIRYANDDVVVKLGNEVVDDNDTMRASKSEDLSFTITTKDGVEIDKVYYGTNGASTHAGLDGFTELKSAGTTYTIGRSSVDNKTVYIVTKRTASPTSFKAEVDATYVGVSGTTTDVDIDKLEMYAGGRAIIGVTTSTDFTAAKKAACDADALAIVNVEFFTNSGADIGDADEFKLGIPASSKTAVAEVYTSTDNSIGEEDGYIATKNIAGTDTLTASFEDDADAHFPKIVVYSKEIPVEVSAMNTMFDKIELESLVTEGASKSGLAGDESDTIRVDATNIDDSITYSIYPYVTYDGISYESNTVLNNALVGDNKMIKSVDWICDPAVASTVKPDDKMYVLDDSAKTAATIETAKKKGTVNVFATVTFADDSTLTTNTKVLTIADKVFGYVAIPTVTVNGNSTYNGGFIDLETDGTTKSATVKWDVYSVNSFNALKELTNNNAVELGKYTATINATEDQVKTYMSAGKISLVTEGLAFDEVKFSEDGIASATAGATSTVTPVKKGFTALYLNARVNGMLVAAKPIYVNVEKKISRYPVTFDPQTNYAGLDEGTTRAAKYDYPEMKSDAAVRSLGTVSEIVDDPTAATKHSVGFVLTDVAAGTVIELPGQDAFIASTISPKIKLYGWDVNGTYHKIGDKVSVSGTTTIKALWAYKYETGIKVYRYDENVLGTLTSPVSLVVSDEASGAVYTIPVVAAYKMIDVEKGPDATTGNAQYDEKEKVASAGVLELTPAHSGKFAKPEIDNAILRANIGFASTETVDVKFTDGDAVYNVAQTGDEAWAISMTSFSVATVDEPTTYSVKIDDATVEVGQTKTITADVKVGETAKKWENFTSVSAKISDTTGKLLKVADITVASNDTTNIDLTGIGVTSSDLTLTVVATDARGNKAEGSCKVKVVEATKFIVPTVTWTSADATVISEEQTTGTVYLKVNEANTVTWAVKDKDGNTIATTNAFKSKNTTADLATIKDKTDINAGLDAPATTYGGDESYVVITPEALGIGQITVEYVESATSVYEVALPVVTYQSIEFVGPTTALKDVYAVYKGTQAIEKDKHAVEKIVYEKGKTTYTFDPKDYSAAWIADTTVKYDHYSWNSTKTNAKSDGTIGTMLTATLEFGKKITKTKGDWEAATGDEIFYPTFGSKKIELSNIPDTITLSDETLSTATANGTDVAVISMGVTPYDSANVVSVTGSDYDMYMLAVGDRESKTGAADPVFPYTTWKVDSADASNSSRLSIPYDGSTKLGDTDELELVDTYHAGTKTVGKARTDTFTVAKINDPDLAKKYVGKSTITIIANNSDYKKVTLYINGEYDTGKKNADGEEIFHYMKDGEDLKDGIVIVQGKKHYYKDGARVNNGIFEDGGKLILINGGAQVTTVGRTTFDGKCYYIGSDGFLITNQKFTGLVTSGVGKDNDKTYYADDKGVLAQSQLIKNADGSANYYDSNCQMAVAGSTAKDYELTKDSKYYVNAAGDVALNGIFKVADVNRLFTEEGKIVTYADTKDGKITVGGVAYVIDPYTNEAKRDDVLYNPQVTWTEKFPAKFTKGSAMPVLKFKVSYTSANTGETKTSDEISVTATTTDDVTAASKITTATFTATADLTGYFTDKEGKTPAANVTITQKYTFKDGGTEGLAGTYTYKSHAFTWPKELGSATKPAVTATVTYNYEEEGAAATIVTLDATVTVSDAVLDGKFKKFTATLTTIDGLTKEETKKYNAETGHFGGDGIEVVGLEEEYDYTGKPIKPAFTVVDNVLDKVLVEGTDYSVSYKDNKKVGTATITIKGKNNYGEKDGVITKQFKIVDPVAEEKPEDFFTVKGVKVASKDGFTYDGTEKYPATLTIKTSEGDVTATWDGSSYGLNVDSTKELKILVTDNIKKGSGVVAVYGNNGKGAFVTKTATFSIKPCDLSTVSEEDLTITPDAAAWAVKGATPAVEVSYKGDVLVEGRDYTLSWKYTNKKDAGENAGEVTVKGKNNFTKKASAVKFNIDALDLNDVKFTVAAYDGVKAKAVKVVAYDQAGVVIPAKQYKVKIEKDGQDITTSKDALKNGDEITVTLEPATTNLDGSATADITVAANLAKVKVVVPKTFTKTYTGEPIELTSEDFESGKISVGSLEFGTDFEVVAYQNNVKKGTMTAYIQGVSDKCSGTGKIKVKIVPQKVKEDK